MAACRENGNFEVKKGDLVVLLAKIIVSACLGSCWDQTSETCS